MNERENERENKRKKERRRSWMFDDVLDNKNMIVRTYLSVAGS